MITKVVNRHKSSFDIYIGRGTTFGNPFKLEDCNGRTDCLDKYERYITNRLANEPELVDELMKLNGKVLGCSCKPKQCHGDVLVKLIAAYDTDESF